MNLYDILKKLNIEYEEIEHEPVFTIEQAQFIKSKIAGVGCNNLFLTNNKGKFYLIVLEESKKANIKEIEKIVNASHLSFASIESLKEVLNLEQGSVTPLGIINDESNLVTLIIDGELKCNKLLVHPNTNKKTMAISYTDLIKFIEYENHKYIIM